MVYDPDGGDAYVNQPLCGCHTGATAACPAYAGYGVLRTAVRVRARPRQRSKTLSAVAPLRNPQATRTAVRRQRLCRPCSARRRRSALAQAPEAATRRRAARGRSPRTPHKRGSREPRINWRITMTGGSSHICGIGWCCFFPIFAVRRNPPPA